MSKGVYPVKLSRRQLKRLRKITRRRASIVIPPGWRLASRCASCGIALQDGWSRRGLCVPCSDAASRSAIITTAADMVDGQLPQAPPKPLHPLDTPSRALMEYAPDPLELEFQRLEREVAAREKPEP